ncbi:toll/interleukin-1 receptor domain-containing protein [Xanthomonas campestris]|uniref:Toll/interleukin-1 receptor domain-containing protein n=1 Tax=Xanthomonas campestris pv. papavericola TaxID=487881 RepID=A0AAJ2X1Y9_XANCA|nr:toll/interleukin-1 receptor domain-containing protein [Xanthomonas campestris]MEC3887414.1 toll/interleukin-1 receptor domain-containing protein [Xanthomonas campestris pv. papavericola]
MKVFLSWSGNRSRAVANLLSDWLACVIQAARPWVSSRDLDRGSLWFGEINDQLKDTSVGVICLTQENKNRPWILFEAGALAKGLSTSRVCTFLIDLEPKDIEDPLAQFNHTFPSRESVLSLVRTLNASLGANALDNRIVEQVFETYWPQFEERFVEILKTTEQAPPTKPRPKEDLLGEILENTRYLSTRLRRLENGVENSQRDYRNISSAIRNQVNEFVELGLPDELIMSELGKRASHNLIAQYIQRAKNKKDDGQL